MTVQAALTQTTGNGQETAQNTPTSAPAVTVLPTTASSPTPVPTVTPLPTPTPKPCNLATFIKDVTVPDGTKFKPGDHFTKTWRLKNVGTCTWHNYALVFDNGERMGAPASVALPGTVAPGQEVDVSVNMVAPNATGTYRSNWRLRDDKGVIFGLTTGNPFWVEIKVVQPTATLTAAPTASPTLPPPAMMVLDFYSEAHQATWSNDYGNTILPFPGSDGDSRGFARYVDAYVLEDGSSHARALEMHPEWVSDGYIVGAYPQVTLPSGAHFRARIGFIAASGGGCGAGDVTFFLTMYTESDMYTLGQWHKTCNGSLQSVDVDLSPYAGRQVEFMLLVDAGASSAQDWAVWVNPVIATP